HKNAREKFYALEAFIYKASRASKKVALKKECFFVVLLNCLPPKLRKKLLAKFGLKNHNYQIISS
ncbi:MAG TPA: hypothetical protein PKL42_07785, partial [Methylotenera sp.]|nr:hypothetical protein [Methylotenera sp.]